MAEWLKAAVLKTVELVRVPGVQIPPSPPNRREKTEDEDKDGNTNLILLQKKLDNNNNHLEDINGKKDN